MKMQFKGGDNEAFNPATDLRVLLAHLNDACALRAQARMERARQESGMAGRLVYRLWDFKRLTEPKLLQMATDDALAADIMVFAAQEGKPLPQGVRDWIARWLLVKENYPCALVASLEHAEPVQPEPVLLPYLAKVANFGKMHFFAAGSEEKTGIDLNKVRAELAEKPRTADHEMSARPRLVAFS